MVIGDMAMIAAQNDIMRERRAATADLLEALKRLHAVAEMTTFSEQFPAECELARDAIEKAEEAGL